MEFYGKENEKLKEYRTMFVAFLKENGLYTPIVRQYGVELKEIRGMSLWVQSPLGLSTQETRIYRLYNMVLEYDGDDALDFIHLIVLYNLETDRQKIENWIEEDNNHKNKFLEFSQQVFDKFQVYSVDVSFLY